MKQQDTPLIKHYGADEIISKLGEFVTPQRRRRIEGVIDDRLQSIHLAIEHPADINNALAAIRTSEALGINTVHIIQPENNAAAIHTLTQGAFYWVDIRFYDSFEHFLSWLKTENIYLAGAIPAANTPLSGVPIEKPICLLIGNEQRGLSDEARIACDLHFSIPMYGMSESMNLSVAAAISLYDTTTRKRSLLKNNGDLSSEQKLFHTAKYFLQSVNRRTINAMFPMNNSKLLHDSESV